MKILPIGDRIYLEIEKPKAGALAMDHMKIAKETAKVLAVGPHVTLSISPGNRIMFKAWAVDICSDGTDQYYFISQSTKGICAVLK